MPIDTVLMSASNDGQESSSLRQQAPAPAGEPNAEQARLAAEKALLFRQNALRARAREVPPASLPQVASGRWVLLGFLATTLSIAVAIGYFGKVEITSIAPGALVVRGGPRPVVAQVSGQVATLTAKAGDSVQAGQQLGLIDATELRARERRDDDALTLMKSDSERLTKSNTQLYEGMTSALFRKRALLAARAKLKQADVEQRRAHATNIERLEHEGAASHADALSARGTARDAEAELLVLRQDIAEIDLQLSDRKKAFQLEQEELRRRVKDAEASRAEAHTLVERAEVRAPVKGFVESLLVTEGQVVQGGALLARIVPEGALNRVVVFAPVKDAAFLHAGLDARVEFASLPVSEFGKAPAKVLRVSSDVASPEELTDVLGPDTALGAVVRVELELSPGPALDKVNRRLRSGERVTARLSTRKRRIATLVFDFLRKWYPE